MKFNFYKKYDNIITGPAPLEKGSHFFSFGKKNSYRSTTPKAGRSRTGFTLVELLVAIGLFAIVLTISLGSVVTILDAGRKARSLQSVMTNLNFTLETMTREIKFGSHYHCIFLTTGETIPPSFPLLPQNCPSGQSAIAFVASDGTSIIYELSNNQILKSIDGGNTFIGVTAPEIVVNNLQFFVTGAPPQTTAPADNAQPRVTIVVSGQAGTQLSTQSSFVVQTTVSQRMLDLGP